MCLACRALAWLLRQTRTTSSLWNQFIIINVYRHLFNFKHDSDIINVVKKEVNIDNCVVKLMYESFKLFELNVH